MFKFIKMILLDFLNIKSSRLQLVWATFIVWMFGTFWFGIFYSFVREASLVYYRQNSIKADPIDLDSPYATTILTMLGTAFMGCVVSYVTSRAYENKLNNQDVGKDSSERTDKINMDIK